jgi:hypothetical protein
MLRKILGPKGEETENMLSVTICALHQMLVA